MLSHKSDYSQSARALAAAAYKVSIIINGLVCSSISLLVQSLLIFVVQEAEEEAKHSSSKKRVTTVVQG